MCSCCNKTVLRNLALVSMPNSQKYTKYINHFNSISKALLLCFGQRPKWPQGEHRDINCRAAFGLLTEQQAVGNGWACQLFSKQCKQDQHWQIAERADKNSCFVAGRFKSPLMNCTGVSDSRPAIWRKKRASEEK